MSGIGSLFQNAHEEGILSGNSLTVLQNIDMGANIQDGLGISVDDVTASEVLLLVTLIDDSGSIRFAGNTQLVRDGHNVILEALNGSKSKDNILAHCRYLNGKILYPFKEISQCPKMDSSNYDANGGTPLYDQAIAILGTALAKSQEFSDNGVPVRTISVIVSDGADICSTHTAKDVQAIVKDMLRQETHIIAAIGIEDPSSHVDFKQIFREMGLQDEWILTPKNTASDIRKAFQVVSQSAVRASQGAKSFSQVAQAGMGGGFAD